MNRLIFGRAAEEMKAAGTIPAALLDLAEITIPPSTNNLFATRGRKRVKTSEYRDWIAGALPILQRLRKVPGPVIVVVRVMGKVNAQRDLDNLLKPIGDTLKHAGVIADDSIRHVSGWDVRLVRGSKAQHGTGRVTVRVKTDEETEE